MVTPEQLKKVAEYLYPKAVSVEIVDGDVIVTTKIRGGITSGYGLINVKNKFNSLQNSDQCLELMEKLIKEKEWYQIEVNDEGDFFLLNDGDEGHGKTINEAVTLAAIAYVEGVKESDDG